MIRSRAVAVAAVIFALVLVGVLYFSKERIAGTGQPAAASAAAPAGQASPVTVEDVRNPFVDAVEQRPVAESTAPTVGGPGRHWVEDLLSVLFRLLLAVVLSGILAFRPRKDVNLFKRSLFVSQTQILLAVVAAALMMIVGDNTARAFAIFAAVSLVRFRTNIRDPKEITVLLISLALGLAAGVGQWELGIALCFFALALLWLLEYNESEQVYRSMELCLKVRDTDRAQRQLKRIFKKNKIDAEVRQIDPPDEKTLIGSLVYYVTLRLNLSTDQLSDVIMRSDPENVDGIQWSQKKGNSDIYQ